MGYSKTDKGQLAGKPGKNVVRLVPSFAIQVVVCGFCVAMRNKKAEKRRRPTGSLSPTPPSPELKVNVTPLAPNEEISDR